MIKFFFVDFKILTKEQIFLKIGFLNKKDGILIRYTKDGNLVKEALKVARIRSIQNIFCHFQNRRLWGNVHVASSCVNPQKAQKTSLSVHSMADLHRIKKVRPNFAFVSPVFHTKTHPNAKPLGKIQALKIAFEIKKASPRTKIVALGGLDCQKFRKLNKQANVFCGFAGIRNL